MSVKEAIHRLIDEMPDDSPWLLDLYEQAQLKKALDDAEDDIKAGRVYTIEEIRARRAERCRQRITE